MEKIKLSDVLDKLKNDDVISVFYMSRSEEGKSNLAENEQFLDDFASKYDYCYATKDSPSIYKNINKSKLTLFFDLGTQKYIGWGLLEKCDDEKNVSKIKKKDKNQYGPYPIEGKLKGYESSDNKWSVYYKFKYTERFKVYIDRIPIPDEKNILIFNTYISETDGKEKEEKFGRLSIHTYIIKNIKEFIDLFSQEAVEFDESDIPKYPDNTIAQINHYDIENVHTAFLSNFIDKRNIYTHDSSNLINFIKIFIDRLPSFYDGKIDKKSVLNDDYEVRWQKGEKNMTPDITIEGNNNIILVEAKYKSIEGEKQTKKYFDRFNKQKYNKKKNVIYIYLYLNSSEINNLSADKKQEVYVKVSFRDLLTDLYLPSIDKCNSNVSILKDYIKSFINTADKDLKLDIEDVPIIDVTKYSQFLKSSKIDKIKEKIQKINCKKIKISSEENDDDRITMLRTMMRYCLAIIYEKASPEEKNTIRKLYNKGIYINK